MRTSTPSQWARTTPPETTPGDDPLSRLEAEAEPDVPRIRVTTRAEPLTITGLIVMCPKCSARRDWLVICDVPGRVFLRCRCAHQWYEPELTRADFDAMIGEAGQKYASLDAAARDTGHDGSMAGAYLPDDLDDGVYG